MIKQKSGETLKNATNYSQNSIKQRKKPHTSKHQQILSVYRQQILLLITGFFLSNNILAIPTDTANATYMYANTCMHARTHAHTHHHTHTGTHTCTGTYSPPHTHTHTELLFLTGQNRATLACFQQLSFLKQQTDKPLLTRK